MADKKKAARKAQNAKLWTKIGIAAGAVALVALIVVSYFTSTTYYRSKTAVEIGDHDISVAGFNYYYQNAYQNTYASLQETYGEETAAALLDTSTPLDEQQFSEDQTWEDYLTETTLASLTEIYAVYDAAKAAGYEMDDAAKAEIESVVSLMEANAEASGYSLDNYLGLLYGKGVNEKLYRELATIATTATEFSADTEAGFTFSDDEIAAYYDENKNEIDSLTAHVYPLTYTKPEESEDAEADEDAEDVVTYEDARADADAALEAGINDAQSFADFVVSLQDTDANKEKYADPQATLYMGLSYSAFNNTDLSDWLFDAARVEGDFTVIEGESEIYLAMFVSRSDNDYPLVDMRHILIAPEEDEEGNEVEGADEAAKTRAEELLAQWQEGGASEDLFIDLANTYSADGNGTTGGLYEDVTQGQMVDPINDWLFAKRVAGDCEVIETEFGWHVVYFVGFGENYKAQLLDDAMRADAYADWHTEVMDGYEAKTIESGMKLTR